MTPLNCFKAYDIRGELGSELNEEVAYRIGRAYAQVVKPAKVAIGGDIRLSSEGLKTALSHGLQDAGVDVIDLGMTGTEEVYFAAQHLDIDGAIEVTASHNPINYNGMKLVRAGAVPISNDSGLKDIRALAESNKFPKVARRGERHKQSILTPYIEHLCNYIQGIDFQPLHLVVNAGNGAAGHVIDALETHFLQHRIPICFSKVNHEPDGHFPNGIPNPLLPENRASTREAVIAHKADMGIAWDGDFDRCFLFDEKGQFIEGYYIVGLLAELFLLGAPGEKIIHDPRLVWNTQDIVKQFGGQSIVSKTGHAFIKERMRKENAIYGGEMSAHHYFRDFGYCDSGMIPWLLVAGLMAQRKQPLSSLVENRMMKFPSSGEINQKLRDPKGAMARVLAIYESDAEAIEQVDGISLEFKNWRFNLRASNTEPVIRLNVEARGDSALVKEKTEEIIALLQPYM